MDNIPYTKETINFVKQLGTGIPEFIYKTLHRQIYKFDNSSVVLTNNHGHLSEFILEYINMILNHYHKGKYICLYPIFCPCYFVIRDVEHRKFQRDVEEEYKFHIHPNQVRWFIHELLNAPWYSNIHEIREYHKKYKVDLKIVNDEPFVEFTPIDNFVKRNNTSFLNGFYLNLIYRLKPIGDETKDISFDWKYKIVENVRVPIMKIIINSNKFHFQLDKTYMLLFLINVIDQITTPTTRKIKRALH